jgi:hypothetical protein
MKKAITVLLIFISSCLILSGPNIGSTKIPIALYPPLIKGFQHFSDDLGYRESLNNPDTINIIGCFGEHQWKESTLRYLRYKDITLRKFRKNPDIFPESVQEEALKSLIEVNKALLRPYECYIGSTIKGVEITHSGLIAACHLAGFNNVRKFLLTNGKTNKRDCFNTSVKSYLQQFQGYKL